MSCPLKELEKHGFFRDAIPPLQTNKTEADIQGEILVKINSKPGFCAVLLKSTNCNGIADIVVFHDGCAGLIEVKKPAKKRRPLQYQAAKLLKARSQVNTRVLTADFVEIVDKQRPAELDLGF